MTGPSEKAVLIASLAAIVPFRLYALMRLFWNMPLRNGPGYFLGVAVPPGFYDRPGGWLRRYHAVLLSEHVVEAAALTTLLALADWTLLPAWTGGGAVLLVATLFAFSWVARRALGGHPPVLSGVAVSLERRRLSDYIWWPAEALLLALVGLSWFLLLRHGGPPHHSWKTPLELTWLALGVLPGKIVLVRAGWPLPPESTEAHDRLQQDSRRYNIGWLAGFAWLLVIVLLSAGLGRTWPAARPAIAWTAAAVFFAFARYILLGQRRIDAQVYGLRPAGSWATPFRRTPLFSTAGLVWFACWMGGYAAVLASSL